MISIIEVLLVIAVLRSKSIDPGAVHSLTLLSMQLGRTPLFAASVSGKLPVAQLLVERGAKLEAADNVCFTSINPHTS